MARISVRNFVIGTIMVAVAGMAAIIYYNKKPSPAPSSSFAGRAGSEVDFANAGANGLKPALEDLAKRINETRDAVKSQGVRIKAIEDRPAFDFKKYEDELRQNILKALPPSVPVSEFKALQQNFPLRSAA